MAGKHAIFRKHKSITGVTFIGLGVLILAGNLVSAAVQLSQFLGITAALAEKLGPLNTANLAISQALWAYLFDHQEFSRGVHRILISFWPVLLVVAGSVVWRKGFAGSSGDLQKKMPRASISMLLVRR